MPAHRQQYPSIHGRQGLTEYLNDRNAVVIQPEQFQFGQLIKMVDLCDVVGIQAQMTNKPQFFQPSHRLHEHSKVYV